MLDVPGATRDQLDRGVVAAQEVLNAARVIAAEAALGRWAYEEWQHSSCNGARPPEGLVEAAAAFRLADCAAIDACCNGAQPRCSQ